MDARVERGIALLNEGKYYAAHDVLEDYWRPIRDDSRPFFQGIVQIAIAMHHFSTGNLLGAQSVLLKARTNLASYPSPYSEIALNHLRSQLDDWQQAMAHGGPYPAPVHIRTGC